MVRLKINWAKITNTGLAVALACLTVVSIAAWFDSHGWVTYQLAQFRLQWAIAAALLAVAFSARRLFAGALANAILVVLNAIPLLDSFLPADTARAPDTTVVTALQINVNCGNKEYDAVRKLVREVDPDLLLVEELTPHWHHELQPVLKRMRYSLAEPRFDTYGIGVYSSVPLKNARIVRFGPAGHPSIDCVCNWGSDFRILHTHLQGPVKLSYYQAQCAELVDVVHHLQGGTPNLIFCGDMNTMSSVSPFLNACHQLKLTDSRRGRGLQLSWPTTARSPLPILTIDHAFVGETVAVVDRHIGPNVGSDHFPIIFKFTARRHEP